MTGGLWRYWRSTCLESSLRPSSPRWLVAATGSSSIRELSDQLRHRDGWGFIALVWLQDPRHIPQIDSMPLQVRSQLLKRFDVGLKASFLRVGDNDQSIDILETITQPLV